MANSPEIFLPFLSILPVGIFVYPIENLGKITNISHINDIWPFYNALLAALGRLRPKDNQK